LEHWPITIKDWYNEAMWLDCQWRQAHTEEKMFGSYRNMTKPQGATSTDTNEVPQGQ